MAANIDRYRKPGDMGAVSFNIHTQRRCAAAKALGAYIGLIGPAQQFLFHFCVKGIRVTKIRAST